MPKCLRDIAQPIPRVQSARALMDLLKAFQAKPNLNAILVVSGTVPLGVLSRDSIGRLLLLNTDTSTPLADLPKTPIREQSGDTPIAKAALELAKSQTPSTIIIPLEDARPAYIPTDRLLSAVAVENAVRAKALISLKAETASTQTDHEAQTSPILKALTHEIRTPLSGMMGLAEVLTERLTDNEARDLAQMILESGRTLDRTLKNANDVVRDDIVKTPGEVITTDLETLVDDLRENWALLAARQKTRFSIDLSPEGPPRIKCNEIRVREIIDNLINNALRFTRAGEVSITMSTQPVDDQPLLSVAISQRGRRLSGAQKDVIKQALETGAMTNDVPGWALGLIVSQKTAQALGGTLTHADNPRGGSVLTLSLPVERADASLPMPVIETPMKSGQFDPGTILLVEDHEASALTLITALETAGWHIIHAHTLTEAKQIAASTPVQAILTDLNLMDGNGLSLIERVRQIQGFNQHVPIISMTAEIGEEKAQLALNAGASWALRKPVEGPNLVALLADMIMRSESKPSLKDRLRKRLVA
ncbi:MAG: response regulator [Pseudomonadota bacterium]